MNENFYNEQDRVFSLDEFRQFDQLNLNANSRIPIFFCVDISASMLESIGRNTRIGLLSDILKKMLYSMKEHPVLGERAVVSIIEYNRKAFIKQPAVDISILNIEQAVKFSPTGNTRFSVGLNRTLQAIDQYRDALWKSDTDTFTPILVFMTDGTPVGDSESDLVEIYNKIRWLVKNKELEFVSVGISKQAKMETVKAFRPDNVGYQVLNEADFLSVFQVISQIVAQKPENLFEEIAEKTEMASTKQDTIDTGIGSNFFQNNINAIALRKKIT